MVHEKDSNCASTKSVLHYTYLGSIAIHYVCSRKRWPEDCREPVWRGGLSLFCRRLLLSLNLLAREKLPQMHISSFWR